MREVVPHNSVRVALLHGNIVGFVAASEVSVAQLYVHTCYQRRGIGSGQIRFEVRSRGQDYVE
jgi:ribosomal protein S18 acetylase RimI-like enzyme